jgi:hypothetical protein
MEQGFCPNVTSDGWPSALDDWKPVLDLLPAEVSIRPHPATPGHIRLSADFQDYDHDHDYD